MSTRAGTAFSSNRAKQNLIKLLFPHDIPTPHQSYPTLRKAYLQKLHQMHPDKFAHERIKDGPLKRHAPFVALQNAWHQYEGFAKQHRITPRSKKGRDVTNMEEVEEPNFTMFGVGCSFADSPEEKRYRNEIMDQASRGWFSAGALPDKEECSNDTSSSAKMESSSKQERISLCDDDLFVSNHGESNEQHDTTAQMSSDSSPSFSSQWNSKYNPAIFAKKSLVDMPFTRRKLYTHHGVRKK